MATSHRHVTGRPRSGHGPVTRATATPRSRHAVTSRGHFTRSRHAVTSRGHVTRSRRTVTSRGHVTRSRHAVMSHGHVTHRFDGRVGWCAPGTLPHV
eukprot:964266-Rhodomonas_salina.1